MNGNSSFELLTPEGKIIHNKTHRDEEIFRLLVDAVTDYAIFAIDVTGRILTWNKGAERLNGYTASEVIGCHFSMFYTPEDIQNKHPQFELDTALQNGRYEEDGWRIHKNGQRFWANVVLTPLHSPSGAHIGFTKVTRDLTERKQIEESRRKEGEKFQLLVESVKDYAIFMLNSDGRIASWNEGAKKFKGYEAREIIGQHFSKFYLPEDIRAKKPEMELEMAQSLGRYEDEGWRLRKDGSTFWANVVITALRDKSGVLFGFSKVTRDLTERRRSEQNLQEAYRNLEMRIKEKTSELEGALRTRDEFLSIASHELKTPITSIKMQLQMAQYHLTTKSGPQVDPGKILKALDISVNQVDRLTQLIDDLLDISRIQAGKLTYSFTEFSFSSVISDVLDSFSHQLAADQIKTYVDESLVGIWDRSRIEQVLVNMIANAIKYAPGSPIVVLAKRSDTKAEIIIQDFGPGIPAEKRHKIFERFERLGQSRNVSGLGLGLFISKQIVEAHGGNIELKPSESGATFVIDLPLDSSQIKRR